MPIRRISLKAVAELTPGQTIWDVDLKGFGVRCQRRAAVYVLKYRDQSGRQRFQTIGQHGSPWTPETARNEAKQRLRDAAGQSGSNASLASSPILQHFSSSYLKD